MQHELAAYIPIPKERDFTPHFDKSGFSYTKYKGPTTHGSK